MENNKILITLGVIVLLVGGYIFITEIIKQEKEKVLYGSCLKDFSDKYCQENNYSESIQWGTGFSPYLYFKCRSERDYEGFGEFINTQEEKDSCKIQVGWIDSQNDNKPKEDQDG